MMTLPRTLFVIVACMLAPCAVQGQVSTFPQPPPLAPPSDTQSNANKNNAPSLEPVPDASGSTSDAKPATSGSGDTASKSTAPRGPFVASTLNSMSALDDKVPLKNGYKISYRVIEDEDDAISLTVTDTGEVAIPNIGSFKVDGKTCHQAALEIKKQLEVNYYKEATVIVGLDEVTEEDKEKPKDMVWVVGEVRSVGPIELSKVQPMSVSQIILRAGGFGDFADQTRVKVIHRSASANGDLPPNVGEIKDAQIVNVGDVFKGKSTKDPMVRSGDYIIVPKVFIKLY